MKIPLNFIGLCLILTIISHTTEAKTYKFKESNYSIKLNRSWKNEKANNIADQTFFSKKSQQTFLIKRLSAISLENDKLPSNKEEFLKYLKTNTSSLQAEKFGKMTENYFTIESFTKNGWSGFLTNLKFIGENSQLNIGYIVITKHKHAYLLTILNHKPEVINNKQINEIVAGFNVLDLSKTIENTIAKIKPLKSTFKSDYFGLEIPDIQGMSQVSNIGFGLTDKTSLFNYLLYNKDLKYEFTVSSYCMKSKALSEKELLTYYIHGHTEALEPFSIKSDRDQMYASGKLLYENSKVHYYYYKAIMFKECQHVVMYHDRVDRTVKPLEDFVKLIKEIPLNHIQIPQQKLQMQNIKHALRLNALANNAVIYSNSDAFKFYQQAVDLDNKDVEYLKNYLFIANRLTKYNQALNTLNKADKNIFSDVEFSSWKAWLLSQTENVSEAIITYSTIFKQNYTNDVDFFRYIELLQLKENWQEMLSVIELNKDKVSKQKTLNLKHITAYYKTGNVEQSKALLIEITDANNIEDYNIFDVLDVYYLMETYDKGVELIEIQINKEIENASLYYYLGVFQYAQKKNDEALLSMQKALGFQPNNKEIQDFITGINLSQGIGDIAIVKTPITALEIPVEITADIEKLQLSDNSDPIENYYFITGYHYKKGSITTKTVYRKYRINDLQSAEEAKTVRLKFNQSYEHPYINKFSVKNLKTNKTTELDINTVYITSANDGIDADGDKLLNIPVPSIDNNIEIEYILSTQSNNLVDNFLLESEYFVSLREYQYMASFLTGDTQDVSSFYSKNIEQIKTDNLSIWKSDKIEKYKQEPHMPDIHKQFDWLKLSSMEKNWKVLGNKYLEKIEGKLNDNISKGLLLSIVPDSKNTSIVAKELAQYVQSSITYQALEFGTRAQIPNKSNKTLQNKYGDCKDHAVLLHDLLIKKGIKSQLALVSTSRYINKDIFTLDQFDHVILYIPDLNGGVFIDPTDKYTAIDLLTPPRSVHGGFALVLENNNSKLIEIPSINPLSNTVDIDRSISQSSDKYIYSETAIVNGFRASDFRSYLQPLNKEHINTEIMEWVNSYYTDITLKDFNYYNLNDLEKPLVIELVFEQDKISSDFKVPAFLERASLSFGYVENRKYPFVFVEPFRIHSSTTTQDKSLLLNDINEKYTSDSIDWSLMTHSQSSSQEFNASIPIGTFPAVDYKTFIDSTKRALFKIEKSILLK